MKVKRYYNNVLENFICREFVEHDIIFLSELLRNMSIDVGCPYCTSLFERLMTVRSELKKELSAICKEKDGEKC